MTIDSKLEFMRTSNIFCIIITFGGFYILQLKWLHKKQISKYVVITFLMNTKTVYIFDLIINNKNH